MEQSVPNTHPEHLKLKQSIFSSNMYEMLVSHEVEIKRIEDASDVNLKVKKSQDENI